MPDVVHPGASKRTTSGINDSGTHTIALAAGLVFCAGLISAAGALFIVVLYGRLIPSASLPALIMVFGGVAALLIVQGLLRYYAGQMADRAGSARYFRIKAEIGAERAEAFLPILRALRGRSFVSVADLAWVPVFFAVAGVIHPTFAILAILFSVLFYRLGQTEIIAPGIRLDDMARERDRRRRGIVSTLRDIAQVSLLALGGALAISGAVHIGELVGATMLSMRALAAVQIAAEERGAIIAAWSARKAW